MADTATNRAQPARPAVFTLHVIGPAPVGGMEGVVRSLAAAQLQRGLRVEVAAVLDVPDSAHPFLAALEESGVPVHVVVAGSRGYLRELRSVERLCRELRPTVLHTHGRRSDVIGGCAGRGAGLPTVATVHGAIGGSFRNRLYMRIQHRALKRADAVVAVSAVIARKLVSSGVDRSRVHLVQNAWIPSAKPLSRAEARSRLDLPPGATVLGWVGRLSPEKGAAVFLEAFARLCIRIPAGICSAARNRGAGSLARRSAQCRAAVQSIRCVRAQLAHRGDPHGSVRGHGLAHSDGGDQGRRRAGCGV